MVSRGGFHVGNGINWKGQVFSKMRNHTLTNRMTVCFQVVSLIVFLCDNTFVDVKSKTSKIVCNFCRASLKMLVLSVLSTFLSF